MMPHSSLIIPVIFLQNKDLNLAESAVLSFIHMSVDDGYNTLISDNEIADFLQISSASIPNILSKFSKLGYIEKSLDATGKRVLTYTYDAPNSGAGKSGYIYIMRDTTNKYIKVGFSNNPSYRESTLQAEKPTIELVKKFKGTMQQEQAAHRILSKYRIRGEWFNATIEQAEEAIKRAIGI